MTLFPEPGDVIFIQANHPIARGIRLAQHFRRDAEPKITHVALVITLDTIIESQFKLGVRIQGIQEWLNKRKVQYGTEEFIIFRSNKKDRRDKNFEILNSAIYQFDAGYAASETITQLPTGDGKSICSDLVAKVLHRANFCDLGKLISSKQVWPGELFSVLLDEGFEEIDSSDFWPSANQKRSSADFVLEMQTSTSKVYFNYERVLGNFDVMTAKLADIALSNPELVDPMLYFFRLRLQTKKNIFEFIYQFSTNAKGEGLLKEFGKTIPYNWKQKETLAEMRKNEKLADELNQRFVQYHFLIGLKGADEVPLRTAVYEVRNAFESKNSDEIKKALMTLFEAYVEVNVRFVAITGFRPEEYLIYVNDRSNGLELDKETISISNLARLNANLTDSYKLLANRILTLREFLNLNMASDLVPSLENEVDSRLKMLEQNLLTR